jgi:shikimate kinase
MNVYLIGYRCTGKTTIGERLAGRLKWLFLDLDRELVRLHGQTIDEMVAQNGWQGFRQAETNLIKKVSQTAGTVIATGGGAVLDPQNVRRMQASGRLIWLRARIDTIRGRLQQDGHTQAFRPPLTPQGTLDEIETTLLEREPIYRHASHLAIETDDVEVDWICHRIETFLETLPVFQPGK